LTATDTDSGLTQGIDPLYFITNLVKNAEPQGSSMIITRATEYAIRAILYMAGKPAGEIVLKKDICQAQEITPAFLTKILQPLIKAGIVGSQRGVGGGFFLARPPQEITLLDVISSQEGPVYLNQCLIEDNSCEREFFCPVHGAWSEIRQEFMTALSRHTFADLAARQEELSASKPATTRS
jgi:Rrf2 family protein